MKAVLVALCTVALVAGCGSSGGTGGGGTGGGTTAGTGGAGHIPPPVDACSPSSTRWKALSGLQVDAAATGSGPTVVFANDSGNTVCAWIPLATKLVAAGRRVAVFTYSDPSVLSDPQNLKDLLAVAASAAKGQKYALVGASLGGRLVIEAAAKKPAGLTGIVSLSGEAQLDGGNDILPQARQVTLPALYAGATGDSYTEGAKQQNELHQAMHGSPNLQIQRPDAAHGVILLMGADGAVVEPQVLSFLKGVLG